MLIFTEKRQQHQHATIQQLGGRRYTRRWSQYLPRGRCSPISITFSSFDQSSGSGGIINEHTYGQMKETRHTTTGNCCSIHSVLCYLCTTGTEGQTFVSFTAYFFVKAHFMWAKLSGYFMWFLIQSVVTTSPQMALIWLNECRFIQNHFYNY